MPAIQAPWRTTAPKRDASDRRVGALTVGPTGICCSTDSVRPRAVPWESWRLEPARGMTEHDRPVDGAGRRWRPAARQAIVQKLVGGRAVVPHGDRGDPAESRRIEHHKAGPSRSDHVVRVLVLHHDVDDRAVAPPHDVLERPEWRHRVPLCQIDSADRPQRVLHPPIIAWGAPSTHRWWDARRAIDP